MKDKELKIKVDENFIEKVDYLQRINDYKNRSDTVRKVVEKEWRKENGCIKCRFAFQQRDSEDSWHPVCGISHKNLTAHDLGWNPDDCPLRKEKEDGLGLHSH